MTTVEYVPSYFDVRAYDPDKVHEPILQSAGLPEIFPARRIGEETYVDGGIVDNVPLAALADISGHAAISSCRSMRKWTKVPSARTWRPTSSA